MALTSGAVVDLPKAIAHHACRVLRLRDGDRIVVWNGDGQEWAATLNGDEKSANVLLSEPNTPQLELKTPVYIIQGLPEGDKMDWVIEKCTEAGAAGFFPVSAQRSVVKLSPERAAKRLSHWQGVALAACNQSGRCVLPTVQEPLPLAQCLQAIKANLPDALCLWLNPIADQPLTGLHYSSGETLPAAIVIAIGPEGGWTAIETEQAHAAGFVSTRLSPRVYRTETAALVTLSQMTALARLEPTP